MKLAPETIKNLAPPGILIAIILFVGMMQPGFLNPSTLLTIGSETATMLILAMGVTFVIKLGGIDLSIHAVASFASVIVALTLQQLGFGAFLLAVVVGCMIGTISGFLHVRLKIPSFVTTLAIGGVAAAAALLLSARSLTIAGAQRDAYLSWISGSALGIPNEIVVAGLVLLIGIFLERYTDFGRYSTAIGAGEPAAWASGIDVDLHKILAFALSGGFAAFAGVVLAGRLASGSPTLANEFLLPAIAAVVVGGTALTGGVGGVLRTAIGALTVSVVRIGMTFVGVDVFAQQIVFGAVLVLAVACTIDRTKIGIVK